MHTTYCLSVHFFYSYSNARERERAGVELLPVNFDTKEKFLIFKKFFKKFFKSFQKSLYDMIVVNKSKYNLIAIINA